MRRGDYDRAAGYRRGAVMGLTMAEAFMLIAFVLLMLLGVWMATAQDRVSALEARIAQAEVAEQFADAFDAEQKAAALAGKEQLALLGRDLVKLDAMRDLIAAGASPSDVVQALSLLPAVREGFTVDQLVESARLLDEATLKALAEAAVKLPPEARVALTDLARLDDFPELAALLRNGDPASLGSDLERVRAVRSGDAASDARDLAAYRATGIDPAQISGLRADVDEVAAARLEARRSRAQIAATVEREAGSVIAGLGGEVRPDGAIVFSDRLLFDSGSARITPAFDAALSQLCRPWIEALHAERAGLSAVRIEGHASSEWTGQDRAEAFARNLDLSQARAASVFKRCLDLAGDDAVADWARTRMSAVGYSSSRPVLAGEDEDRAASRRVVFAIDTPTDPAPVAEASGG